MGKLAAVRAVALAETHDRAGIYWCQVNLIARGWCRGRRRPEPAVHRRGKGGRALGGEDGPLPPQVEVVSECCGVRTAGDRVERVTADDRRSSLWRLGRSVTAAGV